MSCTILLNADKESWLETFTQYLEGEDRFQVTSQSGADLIIDINGTTANDAVVTLQCGEEQTELPFASVTRASLLGLLTMVSRSLGQQNFEGEIYHQLMKKMARVVAHDVRNPLNNILLATAQFKMDTPPEPEEATMYIDIIERSCDRINQLMTDISEPLSDQIIERKAFGIDAILKSAIASVADIADLKDIVIETEGDANSIIYGDDIKLGAVLEAVLQNAVESMTMAGVIKVNVVQDEGSYVNLIVADEGKGIVQEDLPYVFYPFFTTKDRKRGLGLALAQKVVKLHGGNIIVEHSSGEGTTIKVSLPVE